METPITSFLREYAAKAPARWHMPGHKGGALMPGELEHAAKWDITEIDGADNLFMPEGIIRRSQELSAKELGAGHTFYLVGGSTAGIHAMLLANLRDGDTALVDRSCHHSVHSALALCGADPVYVYPEQDYSSGLTGVITPEQVRGAVIRAPHAKAFILTRPNVYGLCCDIESIAKIIHDAGMLLLVDEAHGAHLPFCGEGYPESAGALGADAWVQSAHKTLPALTQSAMLSLRDKNRAADYLNVLSLLQTSSPSYLLMASIESSVALLAARGAELLEEQRCQSGALRKRINEMGLSVSLLDEDGAKRVPGVNALDPSRLTVDVSGTGLSGYSALSMLNNMGVYAEMADARHVVFLGSCADSALNFKMLGDALAELGKLRGEHAELTKIAPSHARMAMSPRKAMLGGGSETVPLKEAEGRIARTCVGAYPPGIPWICPGEIYTLEIIESLISASRSGAGLFGLRDGLAPVAIAAI